MHVSEDILSRFLEDRESLSEAEFKALLAALKADAHASRDLKDLLILDDLCSQAISADRNNFKAQVAQRLRDLRKDRQWAAGDLVKRFHEKSAPRIERPKHAFRPWPVVAAAAVLVLAVSLALLRPWTPVTPDIASVETSAEGLRLKRGESELSASAGSIVRGGDTILNRTDHEVALALLGEDSRISMQADSELSLRRGDEGTHIQLIRGALHARLAPQDPARPVIFDTPHAEVRVIGTELHLALGENNAVRVEVYKGRVQATRKEDGGTLALEAGRYATIAPGKELVTAALVAAAPALVAEDGGPPPGYTAKPWRGIFDGALLKGWSQDKGRWSIENGALVGAAESKMEQAAIMWHEDFADFEVRFSFMLEGNGYLEFRQRVSDEGAFEYSAFEKNHREWHSCRTRISGPNAAMFIDGKPAPFKTTGDVSSPGKLRFYVQNRRDNVSTRLKIKDIEVRELVPAGKTP